MFQNKAWVHFLLILLQMVAGVISETTKIAIITSIEVPQLGVAGQPARLVCNWEDPEKVFYSIRWYLNDEQFYSFITKNNPEKVNHNLAGIDVVIEESDKKTVTLNNLTSRADGIYRCEVMSEGPLFMMTSKNATMAVVYLPSKPVLSGVRKVYREGDILNATCTAKDAKPKASISFSVNDRVIPMDSGLVHSLGKPSGRGKPPWVLYTTASRLSLPLDRSHTYSLKLSCHAHVLSLSVETSIQIRVDSDNIFYNLFGKGVAARCAPASLFVLLFTTLSVFSFVW